jgi:hypothetical protein
MNETYLWNTVTKDSYLQCHPENTNYSPCYLHGAPVNCLAINKRNPSELMLVDVSGQSIYHVCNVRNSPSISFNFSKPKPGNVDLKVSEEGTFCYLSDCGIIYCGSVEFEITVSVVISIRFTLCKLLPLHGNFVISLNNRGILYILPKCGTFVSIKSYFNHSDVIRR